MKNTILKGRYHKHHVEEENKSKRHEKVNYNELVVLFVCIFHFGGIVVMGGFSEQQRGKALHR